MAADEPIPFSLHLHLLFLTSLHPSTRLRPESIGRGNCVWSITQLLVDCSGKIIKLYTNTHTCHGPNCCLKFTLATTICLHWFSTMHLHIFGQRLTKQPSYHGYSHPNAHRLIQNSFSNSSECDHFIVKVSLTQTGDKSSICTAPVGPTGLSPATYWI